MKVDPLMPQGNRLDSRDDAKQAAKQALAAGVSAGLEACTKLPVVGGIAELLIAGEGLTVRPP